MSRLSTPLRAALLVSTATLSAGLAYGQATEDENEDELVQQTVVVRGAFIPDEKRSTSEISSLVDSDDFQVTGDSDAAGALSRVTGVSVSRGKFVFVRGLNERYTTATFNGSPLPSPEPLRRVAPLDLFPTSVLDSVLIQKTWSPEFSAEFGGGLIQLRSKGVPDQAFLDVSGSLTARTDTTFQDGLLYDGGGVSDFLGYDDGTRNLPAGLEGVFGSAPLSSLDPAVVESIGEAFINPALLIAQEGTVGPSGSFSMAGGTRFDVDPNLSIGLVGTLRYSSAWDTREGVRRTIQAENTNPDGSVGILGGDGVTTVLAVDTDRARLSTENEIGLNGLISVGFDIFDDHEIVGTAFTARSTAKEVRTFAGSTNEAQDTLEENYEWFERQVFTLQARGEHYFPQLGALWGDLDDFEVNWRLSYSEAFRDAPFQTIATFGEEDVPAVEINDGIIQGNLELLSANPENVDFLFSKIEDETADVGIDLRLPLTFNFLPGQDVELKAGWAYFESERDTIVRIFQFTGGVPAAFQDQRLDVIFSPDNIGPDGFELSDVAAGDTFPDSFFGRLELDAFYLAADVQLTDFLRISGGVRYEDSLQISDTFNVTSLAPDDGLIEQQLSSEFYLPAVTATWNFADNLQLRGGYSQTITRPQFRELAAAQFINSETDEFFVGNPFLINTETDNYDARLEWYFGRDQFLTLGGFYKEIQNPIEEVGAGFADSELNTFINAPSAELYGFEIEYEQILPLDEWLGMEFLSGRDYIVRTNYTWSDSEVSVDGGIVTTASISGGSVTPNVTAAENFIIDGRQLQGQSRHLVNFQVGWDDFDAGARFRVLVNYSSSRIRTTENLLENDPAIVEDIPLSVDVTYSKEFNFLGGDYEFSFRAANLFGDDYSAFQSGTENTIFVDTYDRGQSFTLGLKRSF
ncbi:MAG: TonB-dependent receptor [Pseudomonadota bacterium]